MNVLSRIVLIMAVGALVTAAQEPAKASPSPSRTSASQTTTDPSYKIGPQDLLRVDVWKEPDITRTVPVRPDGKISLPLLNDVQAARLTAMELAGVIREGLTKYITSPKSP
jgi:polysaccharide biosynthesis/export protein